MTRHLPYRYIQRLWRLKSAACIRPAVLEQDWHVRLLVAAILCVATLPACKAQSIHPKAIPYTPAAGAEKIDINLLRLDADVRGGSKRLETAAAVMGMETVSGRLRLDIMTQSLDSSTVRKIQLPGVSVHHASVLYQRVSVTIADLALLYDLARIPEVRMILPAYGATTSRGAVQPSRQPGDTSHVR